MKKWLCFIMVLAIVLIAGQMECYAISEWLKDEPAGTRAGADIDAYVAANNEALDRLLAGYTGTAGLQYASVSTITVMAGGVVCSNSDGSVRKFRNNTSVLTLTWADIDVGTEGSAKTYYVYAVGDADTATFTGKITESATAPSGITYYQKLGSFYNNASGNIEQVTDGNTKLTITYGTIATGGTIPLPTGFAEAECSWLPSISSTTCIGDPAMGNKCTLTGRVVDVAVYDQHLGWATNGIANYIIIGLRNGI